MDKRIADTIERLQRSLGQLGIRAERIVLFGSHATGTADEHSDIDLAVISGDFGGLDMLQRLETVGVAFARAGIMGPVEALAYTPEEYHSRKRGTFVGDEVKAKGVAVL
ncbi:MAG TPA: nucleotidyltransferase domain-containing protein [Planctomycetota bacterium]|nr:nucleotidyltransferase domain-containing protein [Planctomycetota bacterium]